MSIPLPGVAEYQWPGLKSGNPSGPPRIQAATPVVPGMTAVNHVELVEKPPVTAFGEKPAKA